MSYFDVRIPGLQMTVVAADGQNVHPITAETYDVIVEPKGQDAFTIFAQSLDRTGFATGTLAARDGLRAEVPSLDSRPQLTMADMGHGGMGHYMSAMSGVKDAGGAVRQVPDPHAAHTPAPAPAAPDPHAGHQMPAQAPATADPHAGHKMPAPPKADPHAGHDMSVMSGGMQQHPASEKGNPLVDMQTMAPTSRLDDPGIGVRDNGRRVLRYADLKSAFDDPDGREPARTIELHLTGHMARFAWSFDGIKFSDAPPLRLTYGERLRIVLVNDTMMMHPIHLHGMWSDRRRQVSRAQAHRRYAAWHEALVPGDGGCAGTMGVPLPSPLPHGIWDVPGSAGGGMRRSSVLWLVLVVGSLALCMPAPIAAQDVHTGHQQAKPATPPAPEQDQHQASTDLPAFIPPVSDEDRKAAFPDVQGHAVHDNAVNTFVLFDQLEWQTGGGANGINIDTRGWVGRDRDRFWFRAEGDGESGRLGDAQAHVLYGRQLARWWDVVTGVRQDFRPGSPQTGSLRHSRTRAVLVRHRGHRIRGRVGQDACAPRGRVRTALHQPVHSAAAL